jgi:uncharacterized protein YjbI with pentapeptide repeats
MSTIPLKRCAYVLQAEDANLEHSTFEDVALPAASFTLVKMDKSLFSQVSLADVAFNRVRLDNATFENAHFTNVDIRSSTYEGMRIEGIPVADMLAAWHARA